MLQTDTPTDVMLQTDTKRHRASDRHTNWYQASDKIYFMLQIYTDQCHVQTDIPTDFMLPTYTDRCCASDSRTDRCYASDIRMTCSKKSTPKSLSNFDSLYIFHKKHCHHALWPIDSQNARYKSMICFNMLTKIENYYIVWKGVKFDGTIYRKWNSWIAAGTVGKQSHQRGLFW